jgi:hypothetical protein
MNRLTNRRTLLAAGALIVAVVVITAAHPFSSYGLSLLRVADGRLQFEQLAWLTLSAA